MFIREDNISKALILRPFQQFVKMSRSKPVQNKDIFENKNAKAHDDHNSNKRIPDSKSQTFCI